MRGGSICFILLGMVSVSAGASDRSQPESGPTAPSTRMVHRFDFDERAEGNLEDIPKFWEQLRPSDFPHFAKGQFDESVGRSAPPSFLLSSEGRNVAFQYKGPETRIRVNTDYRIVGYIRPDHLVHARACVSVHYLDDLGNPLPKTLVRSPYFGGNGSVETWMRFELQLVSAPINAHSIALIGWVLQESQWSLTSPRARSIPRNDVRAAAWLDDITIYALPQAALTTARLGDVLTSDGPQELQITLADSTGIGIEGTIRITAADGRVVVEQPVPVTRGGLSDPFRLSVEHLPPGIYRAELDVFADGDHVVSRFLTFARLGDLYSERSLPARSFGMVFDPTRRTDSQIELALLEHQGVGSVKIPVWTGLADRQDDRAEHMVMSRLLQSLARRGFVMYGVFFGPPADVVRSGAGNVRPLVDLLADDPEGWKEQMALVVAPFAGIFHTWQVGSDGAPPIATAPSYHRAVTQLKNEMRPYISVPKLCVPINPSEYSMQKRLPVSEVTACIGRDTHVNQIDSQISRLYSLGFEKVSAYIEPLPDNTYRRIPRLADWAQRIISARHAGATTVFVPQTWKVNDDLADQPATPLETLLVLRTIADLVGDAEPGPVLQIAEGVRCLAFYSGNESVLAIWDSRSSQAPKPYTLQLGAAQTQVDIFGVATPLERDERGRQIVRVSSVPVFIPGAERWLIEFRTAFDLQPNRLEFGAVVRNRVIDINYRGNRPVLGDVRLEPPPGWQVTPTNFSFALGPRRSESHPIELRFPHNEPAGTKILRAVIQLAGSSYELDIPLSLELGSPDLEVWGLAVVQGNRLLLRHVIKNVSSEILSFRASASVPGRERQYRPIPNLRPQEIQTVEYRFLEGRELSGRSARLMLREVNDGPRSFSIEKTIP